MSGPSGHPPAGSAHRSFPSALQATTCSPVRHTPSRAAPHELHLDQRRATQGHQPQLSDQEDLRRRSILFFFAMPPVHPAPHPAPKFTRRRLTFPQNDGDSVTLVFISVRRRGRGATRRYDTSNAVSAAANTSQSPLAAVFRAARSRATKLSSSNNDPAFWQKISVSILRPRPRPVP